MKIKIEFTIKCILANSGQNIKKNYLFQAIIISILILNNKIVINFSYSNQKL